MSEGQCTPHISSPPPPPQPPQQQSTSLPMQLDTPHTQQFPPTNFLKDFRQYSPSSFRRERPDAEGGGCSSSSGDDSFDSGTSHEPPPTSLFLASLSGNKAQIIEFYLNGGKVAASTQGNTAPNNTALFGAAGNGHHEVR